MSEWMRLAVEEVYRQQLGIPRLWTAEQTALFLNLVTQRLDSKAAVLGLELGEQAVAAWTQANGPPDHQTAVGLHETALENAREAIVREDLYDLIPQPDEGQDSDPVPVPVPVPEIPWAQRWRHLWYRADPDETIEDLADHLWPERSAMFRVKGAYLLATRREENRVVPTDPGHPLAAELAREIQDALKAEGYPAG